MSKLFLHIGHGKTGTSYLQSVFARNKQTLADHGIDYPCSPRILKAAAEGETTSGNRAIFLNKFQNDPDYFATENSLLFSGESLWRQFWSPDFAPELTQMADRAGKSVALLFFIRDPIAFQLSEYLQYVQQRTEIQEMNRYFSGLGSRQQCEHMKLVLDVQQQCEAHGLELTIVNYSRARNELLDKVTSFLELPAGVTLEEPARTVNRSIGAFEVGVKRGMSQAFNGMKLPKSTNYIRRLVDTTSEMRMPPPVLSDAALETFTESVKKTMEAVNAHLAEETRYQLEYARPETTETLFTEDYGFKLAQEIVRSTLTVMNKNLDDAGREVVLGYLIANDPTAGLPVLREYASILMRLKAYEKAIPIHQRILEIHPLPEAYFQLIMCFRALKKFKEALQFSQRLFDISPTHYRNVSVLVHLLAQSKKFRAARKQLGKARLAGLADHKAHFLEYRIELHADNEIAALSALKAASLADPTNERYLTLLEKS